MKAHLITIALFLAIALFYALIGIFPAIAISIILVLLFGVMYWMALFAVKMYLKDKENDRTS